MFTYQEINGHHAVTCKLIGGHDFTVYYDEKLQPYAIDIEGYEFNMTDDIAHAIYVIEQDSGKMYKAYDLAMSADLDEARNAYNAACQVEGDYQDMVESCYRSGKL